MKGIMVRFPTEIRPRLDRLLRKVQRDSGFSAVRVTLSTLLRMLILKGLELEEARYEHAPED